MSQFDDEWEHPIGTRTRRRVSPEPIKSRRVTTVHRLPQDKLVAIARARHKSLRKYGKPDQIANEDARPRPLNFLARRLAPLFKRGGPVIDAEYEIYPAPVRAAHHRMAPPIGTQDPILDIRSVILAIYESRRLIIALFLLGLLGGAAATTLVASKYTARSSLFFDPKQTEFSWDGDSSNATSSETVGALIDSQIQILTSNAVLQTVVSDLALAEDPEFTGAGSTETYAVAEALKQSVTTTQNGNSYVVWLSVTTTDPEKSATIANTIVSSFLDYENKSASTLYTDLNAALDRRLVELRKKVHEAEAAVDAYRAKNDLVTANGDLISEGRLAALNEALVKAQQATIEAGAKVDAASRLSLQDAVAGANDSNVASATLVELRRQYATVASNLGRLESQLGARHPSLTAAKGSLEGLRAEIRQELTRITSIAKTSLAQAQKAEQEIAKELAAQKALKLGNAASQAELGNLELQATAARNIYEAVLKRTRETNEDQNIAQSNIRVIEKAEPPVRADGPGRSVLLVAGLIGGAIFGIGIGMAIAIVRRMMRHPLIRSYFSTREYY